MGDLLWKAYAKKWMPISGLLCYPVLNQADNSDINVMFSTTIFTPLIKVKKLC